jgi:hypothetical protein
MRCPRKLYLVVSRRAKAEASRRDMWTSRPAARMHAEVLNNTAHLGATDWRVEAYPKGD